MDADALPVFPPPRRADLSGGAGPGPLTTTAIDRSLPTQGYRITFTDEGSTVEGADAAGLRYGLDSLAQLAGHPVGTGTVEDSPVMTTRAYMLDVSRDRVPTMATLDRLVGWLAALRYNELELYTEHTFAWPEHEAVWRHASPMTAAEVAWLDERCAREGIELVPCLNGFGHMERFLQHAEHRDRAECPDGWPRPGSQVPAPPTTLAPNEDNARFALELFRGYAKHVRSRRIHIGGDEPFELGRGRSAEMVANRGRSAVYLEHLRRLVDPLLVDGHDVLFWGDILRDAPEHVASLPPDGVTAVAWHYEAPRPDAPPLSSVIGAELAAVLGMPEDSMRGFSAHVRTFAETGFPFRVAAGTSTWNSLIGRLGNARANIDDAVVTGLEHGAVGFQLTDWGDHGHHHPLAISLAPLVHGARAAWTGRIDDRSVGSIIDRLTGEPGLGQRLEALGSIHERLGLRSFNASPLCQAVMDPTAVRTERLAGDEVLHDVVALLDDTIDRCGPEVADELAAVCRLARVGVERLAHAAGRPMLSTTDAEAATATAIDRQRAAWLTSSRPGGLDDSLSRIARHW